jgi:hypothetical protein
MATMFKFGFPLLLRRCSATLVVVPTVPRVLAVGCTYIKHND